jgi:hypothetical protein
LVIESSGGGTGAVGDGQNGPPSGSQTSECRQISEQPQRDLAAGSELAVDEKVDMVESRCSPASVKARRSIGKALLVGRSGVFNTKLI